MIIIFFICKDRYNIAIFLSIDVNHCCNPIKARFMLIMIYKIGDI